MPPPTPLPYSTTDFPTTDAYIDSLLHYCSTNTTFQTLCGGVHILDFFTREPSLYHTVIPSEWRAWLLARDSMELLDFLMRDDLDAGRGDGDGDEAPESLMQYVREIRRLSLRRDVCVDVGAKGKAEIPRAVSVGMVPKKVHEVGRFAEYVERVAEHLSSSTSSDLKRKEITHFVDFGSGQNYLGRTLASPPYNKYVVAVESKEGNISGAKNMDVLAGVAAREKVVRNKKLYRRQQDSKVLVGKLKEKARKRLENAALEESNGQVVGQEVYGKGEEVSDVSGGVKGTLQGDVKSEMPVEAVEEKKRGEENGGRGEADFRSTKDLEKIYVKSEGKGYIHYVEHIVKDGDLSDVVEQIEKLKLSTPPDDAKTSNDEIETHTHPAPLIADSATSETKIMAISIHSCGNLSHHGIRSLILNPTVHAIAIVGCCYNLLTTRLSPPTHKVSQHRLRPNLRAINAPRVTKDASTCDPHGFPMSERVGTYGEEGEGINLNITARMMAVQAPGNWTEKESDGFFTRHFYRALLQRVFLEKGVVRRIRGSYQTDETQSDGMEEEEEGSLDATEPVIIGSLRKGCYASFTTYVRGALEKLYADPARSMKVREKVEGITDQEIEAYWVRYEGLKKELSVTWSLMAFSAGVVESLIVVDRYLWLREQGDVVRECWVEAVFDYGLSPRNLVVVGIKK